MTGRSVRVVGNVNQDGYTDILIGAPYANNYGAVYLVYGQKSGFGGINLNSFTSGGVNVTGTPTYVSTGTDDDGNECAEFLGSAVRGAGDWNHDGIPDVMMNAPYACYDGLYSAGSVIIVYGSNHMTDLFSDNIPASKGITIQLKVNLTHGVNGFFFGTTLDNAGDFNGDGISDIIVSTCRTCNSVTTYGVAVIIYGTNGTRAESTLVIDTNFQNTGNVDPSVGMMVVSPNVVYAALSVSGAGDFNGDGKQLSLNNIYYVVLIRIIYLQELMICL